MQARNTEKIRSWKVEKEDRRYKNLRVWQGTVELVEAVYGMTKGWPREECFGLAGQMQRAALGIPGNIAEGHGHPEKAGGRVMSDYSMLLGCMPRGAFLWP
ncbi:MAG: four helix bundle protein [Alcanivorax jadensis]|uniref:four helix bundle protein n=1 Tax=Alcanivorax jadensis TaxID=64988 RepID=UPI003001B850